MVGSVSLNRRPTIGLNPNRIWFGTLVCWGHEEGAHV
jgi:hypothetical protein